MSADWPAALEALPLARALRDSVWIYPLVNAGHIFGVALLVGAIVPLDLRLMGLLRAFPLAPLWRVLGGAAAVGLVMAAIFGTLLFATRASEYLASPFFLAKAGVIALGVINALVLRLTMPARLLAGDADDALIPLRVRAGAIVSFFAWIGTLTLGRLVGYF